VFCRPASAYWLGPASLDIALRNFTRRSQGGSIKKLRRGYAAYRQAAKDIATRVLKQLGAWEAHEYLRELKAAE
jgi:hypothetical protein